MTAGRRSSARSSTAGPRARPARRPRPRPRAAASTCGSAGPERRTSASSIAPAGPCWTSAAAPDATSMRSRGAGRARRRRRRLAGRRVALARRAGADGPRGVDLRSPARRPGAGTARCCSTATSASAGPLTRCCGVSPDCSRPAGRSSSSSTRRGSASWASGFGWRTARARASGSRGRGWAPTRWPGRRARQVCACGRAGATAGASSRSCRRHEGAARADAGELLAQPAARPVAHDDAGRAAAAARARRGGRRASSRTPPTSPASARNAIVLPPGGVQPLRFGWPTSPSWLYAVTQGIHVTVGIVAVPLLLAKLWSVSRGCSRGRRCATPRRRSSACRSLGLVGGAIFEFATGILNVAALLPVALQLRRRALLRRLGLPRARSPSTSRSSCR